MITGLLLVYNQSKEWEWLKPFLLSVVLMLFPEMQTEEKKVPYESTVVTETILLLGC